MHPLLTFGLSCTLLLGAASCNRDEGKGPKEKKKKLVADDPVLASDSPFMITEIVPHAEHALVDADGDASDWIELHNKGSEEISLAGYALTDDKEAPLKWSMPGQTLAPGSFVIVFASGKDRAEAGSELHANFKLASDGEYLALVRVEDQQAVHTFAPIFPKVPKGKSYGYGFEDGAVRVDQWEFFDTPSPGEANADAPEGSP